uniref:Uncharacterized protein LOC111108564 isoform X2 n=1 Tax=Crassostrea virginica TaxID=6565 RepID=A0A8B8BA17_CRAVI|nr:uncharacterized protein LOC111108564 isoform X2 [Crassostrea virginica]
MDPSVLCSYSLIFVLLLVTTWFPEQCYCNCISQQCNDSSTNKMEGKNAKVESFGISIKTQWNTLKEKRESNNLWTCLTNKSCPLWITRKGNNSCLCSDSICARTVCKHTMKTPSQMKKVKCNIKVNSTIFVDCLFLSKLQPTERKSLMSDKCSLSKKRRYFFEEGKLQITEFSDLSTRTTMTMANLNASNDPTSGIRSNFWNIWEDCSDLSECSFFVMSKRTSSSSTYVCVRQIHKSYCYRLTCNRKQKFQTEINKTWKGVIAQEEGPRNWKRNA